MIVVFISLSVAVSSPLLLCFFLLSAFLAVGIRLELFFYLSSLRLPPLLSSTHQPSVTPTLPSASIDRLVLRSFASCVRESDMRVALVTPVTVEARIRGFQSYHHLPICSTRDRPFTVSVGEDGIYICNRVGCR
ncbi:hypothetical protein M9H77_13999 [Catharanthus roseus]|uniref:Uncharacterized protein n=1 Tax=Catharanthus roseus TaxID=4058 RepID=A0ACC0BLZ5_CATRO|nr:hypothetical protein M9H77_13999 [Catharanthus roseus]